MVVFIEAVPPSFLNIDNINKNLLHCMTNPGLASGLPPFFSSAPLTVDLTFSPTSSVVLFVSLRVALRVASVDPLSPFRAPHSRLGWYLTPRRLARWLAKGVHNVLVHSGELSNLKIFNQGTGPVANLQARKAVIEGNNVYNEAGKEVAVVHQYDRDPSLQKYLFGKVRLR